MILSHLVDPDPEGFIELDKNLASHIGEANVEAFHKEAGDLVVDSFLTNPVLVRELMNDHVVVRELAGAMHRFQARAFGLSEAPEKMDSSEVLVKTMLQACGNQKQRPDFLQDLLAGEILTNQVINDRTMRNPVIMRELKGLVTEFYKAKLTKHGKGGKGASAP